MAKEKEDKKRGSMSTFEVGIGLIGLVVFMSAIKIYDNYQSGVFSEQKEKVEEEIKPEDVLVQAKTYLNENSVESAEQKLTEIRNKFPDFASQKEFTSIEVKIDSIKGEKIKRDVDIAVKELKSFSVDYVSDIEVLNRKVNNFGDYENLIYKAYAHSDEMGKYSRKLMVQLRNAQSKYYPQMRRKYAGFLRKMYWIDDIDVKVLGSRADRIQFIGGTFASNRNINTYYEATVHMLKKYRYKRADYKWIPSESEYTYYKIDSQSDSHLSGSLEYIK